LRRFEETASVPERGRAPDMSAIYPARTALGERFSATDQAVATERPRKPARPVLPESELRSFQTPRARTSPRHRRKVEERKLRPAERNIAAPATTVARDKVHETPVDAPGPVRGLDGSKLVGPCSFYREDAGCTKRRRADPGVEVAGRAQVVAARTTRALPFWGGGQLSRANRRKGSAYCVCARTCTQARGARGVESGSVRDGRAASSGTAARGRYRAGPRTGLAGEYA